MGKAYEMRNNISDLRWVVIEKVFGNVESQIKTRLLQREVYWMVTLDTKAPNGLNENCSFNVFLQYYRALYTVQEMIAVTHVLSDQIELKVQQLLPNGGLKNITINKKRVSIFTVNMRYHTVRFQLYAPGFSYPRSDVAFKIAMGSQRSGLTKRECPRNVAIIHLDVSALGLRKTPQIAIGINRFI